jgi:hypothetical protein
VGVEHWQLKFAQQTTPTRAAVNTPAKQTISLGIPGSFLYIAIVETYSLYDYGKKSKVTLIKVQKDRGL